MAAKIKRSVTITQIRSKLDQLHAVCTMRGHHDAAKDHELAKQIAAEINIHMHFYITESFKKDA